MKKSFKKWFAILLALLVLSACGPTYDTTTTSYRYENEKSVSYDVSTRLELKTEQYKSIIEQLNTLFTDYDIDLLSSSEYSYASYQVSYLQKRDLLNTYFQLKIPKEQYQAFRDELQTLGDLQDQGTTASQIEPKTSEDIELEIQWRKDEIARMEQELDTIEPKTSDDVQVRATLREQIRQYKEEIRNLETQEDDEQTKTDKVSVDLRVLEIDPSLNPDQARTSGERLTSQFSGMLKRIGWIIQDTLFIIMMVIPYVIPFILLYYTYKIIRNIWWKINPYAKQRREYRRARRFAILKKYYNYIEREFTLEDPKDEALINTAQLTNRSFNPFRKKKNTLPEQDKQED